MKEGLIKINGPNGQKFVFRKTAKAEYANRFFVFPGERDISVVFCRAEPFEETREGEQILDVISKVMMAKETFLEFADLVSRVCESEFIEGSEIDCECEEPERRGRVAVERFQPGHAVLMPVVRDPKKRN